MTLFRSFSLSRICRGGHSSLDWEDNSIRFRAFVLAELLSVLLVPAAQTGCSGDRSLGGGIFAMDAATLTDSADANLRGSEDGGGDLAASSCSSASGIDAGGGLGEGLIAWYRCEAPSSASSTLLPDATGHGHDGTLVTGTGSDPGYSFATGKVGNALHLSYTKQGYVSLPAGLLANLCEVTIATWVYVNSNVNAWTRIWDFGQDTTSYMFLTPITNLDDFARFGISVSGNQHEQGIKATAAVPTLQWTHVALVLGPSGGTLYFNGVAVGTSTSISLRPADLGRTLNNYIGRSQFSDDPYLDANIDEFRIYNRALSPAEIQALASGS
jgi:hypothetical protein